MSAAFLILMPLTTISQIFNCTYKGTTVTYSIISVPKHEAEVVSVPKNVTAVTIPASIVFNGETFKVTEISGFRDCKLLKSVVLPNTVKTINEKAFYGCSWLRSINLPLGLEVIGKSAFRYCESLTSITLPTSIKKIGRYAFSYCENLRSINLPSGLEEIDFAFHGCKNLKIKNISKDLGFIWNDTVIVLNTNNEIVKHGFDEDDYGFVYTFGNKKINNWAFHNYTIITDKELKWELVKDTLINLKSFDSLRQVNDIAGLFTKTQQNELEQRLVTFNDTTSYKICVVTVTDLMGYGISELAVNIGNHQYASIILLIKQKNNTPGGVTIKVSTGLKEAISHTTTKKIIDNELIPLFNENDYYGGVSAAINLLCPLATGEINELNLFDSIAIYILDDKGDTIRKRNLKPNSSDKEIQEEKNTIAKELLVAIGDSLMKKHKYAEAKSKYNEALNLAPKDTLVQNRITNINNLIVEEERTRIEAEEKARREDEERKRIEAEIKARRAKEERWVESVVDDKNKYANSMINQGHLQKAIDLLQEAIDTAAAHSYAYRRLESRMRIDSIKQAQSFFSDTSMVYDFKNLRPSLYNETDRAITLKIKSFMIEKNICIERNNMSVALYTHQKGTFQFNEPSNTLKKLCKEMFKTEYLPPIIIDDKKLNSKAIFNYSVEYAIGTVKVKRWNLTQSMDVQYDISSQLENDMRRMFSSSLGNMPTNCDGNYSFTVTSMDINGQMEHMVRLRKCNFRNGPQNAWKSLLVPGLGNKYVNENGELDIGCFLLSYGCVGYGIYCLSDRALDKDFKKIGLASVSIGAAIWLGNIVYVWGKGAKNKHENKEQLNQINFAYDIKFDAPEVVYSLKF